MAVGKWLDWLQRGQAVWTLLKAAPLVTGATGLYLSGVGHVPLWQLYLITLFSVVGGFMIAAYAKAV